MDNGPKRLYRSRVDRKIAGVCGGIAQFINLDVTIVRLLMILFCFAGGSGILVYLAAAIIMPEEPLV